MGGCVTVQECIQVRGNKTTEGSKGDEKDTEVQKKWKPLKQLGTWANVLTSGDDRST